MAPTPRTATRFPPLLSLASVVAITVCAPAPPDGYGDGDWPAYGRDAGGSKFSPLDHITRENVGGLEVAWQWETGESPIPGPIAPIRGQQVRPGNFEATPLAFNDTLYFTTPYNRVIALDGSSGETLWDFDPRTVEWGQPPNGTGFVHRGVAVWNGSDGRRIFLNTRWRLIAIDGATGEPIESFGHRGEIDLTEKLLWRTNRLHYTQTSPPVVFEDLLIIGNGVWDGFVYPRDPPGNIQAFDVRTGELVWSFNLIPQPGEPGNETWEDGSWDYTGHTNAWAPMVVDEERGLLYAGIGTPSNDYYGGHRKGDNLYAESLVALDARTGELAWHFQTIRHGLWDFDLPGAPVLLTVERDGEAVDAVAVAGKTGFVYTFDRGTGEPVWPIEERPVPESDVPGEVSAATQPFPTRPPPFAKQGFTPDDLIDLTPELRRQAEELTAAYRFGPLFEPPSLEGTIAMPGILGGGNWGGAAFDPRSGFLYVKSSEEPSLLKIAPADPETTVADYGIDRGAPRTLRVSGLPISNPPWGTLTAIDMNAGEIVWQEAVGERPEVRDNPALEGIALPARLGVVAPPGPFVTAGGLVFLTGGSDVLYAFDASDGEVLWEGRLPAPGYANPMTFRTRDGRQLVVVATGGREGGTLVAFGLPG
ncbi:MAG: pyrroloquinoline quinone-dependent dehydrogenase [Gemmatimonadetes bacterium]|nr:pyrroloquinoline quinone-dependent dehydrogenase [Gemmatimonadota bacterium]